MLMSLPDRITARSNLPLPLRWVVDLLPDSMTIADACLVRRHRQNEQDIDERKVRSGMQESEGKAGYGVKIFPIIVSVLLALSGSSYAATCSFVSLPGTLNFGNLDPGLGNDVIRTTIITIRCTGAGANPVFFTITDDDGLYETGVNANRMRNTSVPTEFLPYSMTYSGSGSVNKGTNLDITITTTVLGMIYQDAYVGSYSDMVTFTVSP